MKLYHDRNLVLSRNPRLAFICLARGCGKSFGYKSLCVEDFINKGRQFMYIRRYKNELKEAKSEFMKDIKHIIKDNEIKISGDNMYINGKVAGYFKALSTAGYMKSSAYNDVYNIMYDEIFPEGKYIRFLPDECSTFSGFLSTVVRRRDFRCFLICNKISTISPYQVYFNIPPFDKNYFDPKRRILIWAEEDIDVKHTSDGSETPLLQVLKGTDYESYAFDNSVLDNSENIRIKNYNKSKSKCIFILNIKGEYVGVFFDEEGDVILDCNCDKTFPVKYNFDVNNLKECEKMFTKNRGVSKIISNALDNGFMFFANPKTKILAKDILKYF